MRAFWAKHNAKGNDPANHDLFIIQTFELYLRVFLLLLLFSILRLQVHEQKTQKCLLLCQCRSFPKRSGGGGGTVPEICFNKHRYFFVVCVALLWLKCQTPLFLRANFLFCLFRP